MRVPEIDGGRNAWYGWFTAPDDPPPAGTYRAKVEPKPLRRTGGHRHICKGARSNAVTLADSAARARSVDPLGGLLSASDLTRLR